jgi:hypothetical protein
MRLCELDDCDRPHYAKGLCEMHYQRLRSNGDPLVIRPAGRKPEGKVCTLEGCDKPRRGRGLCGMHLARLQRNGEVGPAQPMRKPLGGHDSVHRALRAERGVAREHVCPCGAPAAEWALTGPRDLVDPTKGFPYSENLDDYTALCRSCHNRLDKSFHPGFGARLRRGGI